MLKNVLFIVVFVSTYLFGADTLYLKNGEKHICFIQRYENSIVYVQLQDGTQTFARIGNILKIEFDSAVAPMPRPVKSPNNGTVSGDVDAILRRNNAELQRKIEDKSYRTDVSMEKLKNFPEKYAGGKYIFKNVRLDNAIYKSLRKKGFFLINIKNEGGTLCSTYEYEDNVCFIMSSKLAEQFAEHSPGEDVAWVGAVVFSLLAEPYDGNEEKKIYYANIEEIYIINASHTGYIKVFR